MKGHAFYEKEKKRKQRQRQKTKPNKKGNQSSKVSLSTCLYFNFINKLVAVKRLLMSANISDRSTCTL